MPDVAQLLTDSIAAHLRYRQASNARNTLGVRAALAEALQLRLAALEADPQREHAVWGGFEARYPHESLLAFYAEKLNS